MADEGGDWDGALGEAGGGGEDAGAAQGPAAEEELETSAEEPRVARKLRSATAQPYPDQGPRLKMGEMAVRERDRVEGKLRGAGLAVLGHPTHWERLNAGLDVRISIRVQRLGLLTASKPFWRFARSKIEMTDAERERLEAKLWEGLHMEVCKALGPGRRARKRAQGADEPSTSAAAQPHAEDAEDAADEPPPPPDPLGIAWSSATTLRGRMCDQQRYLKTIAADAKAGLLRRLGAAKAEECHALTETTQRALDALARLDHNAATVVLPMKKAKRRLTPNCHEDELGRVEEVLRHVFHQLTDTLAVRSPAGPLTQEAHEFRESWAVLGELWRRLEEGLERDAAAPPTPTPVAHPAPAPAATGSEDPPPPAPDAPLPSAAADDHPPPAVSEAPPASAPAAPPTPASEDLPSSPASEVDSIAGSPTPSAPMAPAPAASAPQAPPSPASEGVSVDSDAARAGSKTPSLHSPASEEISVDSDAARAGSKTPSLHSTSSPAPLTTLDEPSDGQAENPDYSPDASPRSSPAPSPSTEAPPSPASEGVSVDSDAARAGSTTPSLHSTSSQAPWTTSDGQGPGSPDASAHASPAPSAARPSHSSSGPSRPHTLSGLRGSTEAPPPATSSASSAQPPRPRSPEVPIFLLRPEWSTPCPFCGEPQPRLARPHHRHFMFFCRDVRVKGLRSSHFGRTDPRASSNTKRADFVESLKAL